MLQVTKLLRLVGNERHGQVIEEILRNGRPLPVAVRSRLAEPASARLASLGLAMQRVVELTYMPTAEAAHLAAAAVDAWNEREGAHADVPAAATAILVAGLADVLSQVESTSSDLPPGLPGRIRATIRAACYELAATQEGEAVRNPRQAGLVGGAIDSVVVLWQLAPREHALSGFKSPNLDDLECAATRLELWRDPACGQVLALAHAVPEHMTMGPRRIAA